MPNDEQSPVLHVHIVLILMPHKQFYMYMYVKNIHTMYM